MAAKNRYHVEFGAKWANSAIAFAGLSFFLLCVYYFGFTNLIDCNIGQILFSMLLPMAAVVGVVVFLRVVRKDDAKLLAAMGCIYALLMLIRAFSYGSVINTIVAVVWYLLAAGLCLGALTGILTDINYLSAAFLIPAVFRLVFIDIAKYLFTLSFVEFIREAAALAGLAAFGLGVLCITITKFKRTPGQNTST